MSRILKNMKCTSDRYGIQKCKENRSMHDAEDQ